MGTHGKSFPTLLFLALHPSTLGWPNKVAYKHNFITREDSIHYAGHVLLCCSSLQLACAMRQLIAAGETSINCRFNNLSVRYRGGSS